MNDDQQSDSVPVQTPQIHDEDTVSGSTPSTSSDDDVLENAHDMGLYPNATDENPQELNIADQIDRAEKAHREN